MAQAEGGSAAPPPAPEFDPFARRPKRRWGLKLALLLLIAGGAAWGWQRYGERYYRDLLGKGGEDVPLLRADAQPIKIKPEHPGGMPAPDRDKLVYERLAGEGKAPKVEHLLPPPEAPLPVPKPAAKLDSPPLEPRGAAKPEAIPPPPPPAPPAKPDAGPQARPLPVVPTPRDVGEAKRPEPAPPPPDPVKAVAPAKKPEAPAEGASGFQIQLAAVRSQAQAESEWERVRRGNADIVGGLSLVVARADLGEARGVFFRVRAGPIGDEATARDLCARFAQRKIGCLVVRPGQ